MIRVRKCLNASVLTDPSEFYLNCNIVFEACIPLFMPVKCRVQDLFRSVKSLGQFNMRRSHYALSKKNGVNGNACYSSKNTSVMLGR